jgi:predicted dehydrogenase
MGCGHWGIRWIKTFEDAGAIVRLCCDVDEGRLRIAGDAAPYAILTTDYKDIVFRKDVDAVYIATPPQTHFGVARDCLLAGKHVLVEKPLTTKYAQGVELAKLAEERQRVLMTGNTYMYNSAVQRIKQLVDDGAIGKLRHINLCITDSLDMWPGKDIRNYANVIWDLGPHPISIINYILGEWPNEVTAFGPHPSPELNGNFDAISVNLSFPSQVTATFYLSWLDHRVNRRIIITGENGVVSCDNLSDKESIGVCARRFAFSNGQIRLGSCRSFEIDVRNTLLSEAKHFLYCVSNGRTPISDGANGSMIVAVVEAIHKSISRNEPCKVVEEGASVRPDEEN